MGKSQRDKGKRWEQDCARRLREVMPGVEWRRSLQADGANVPDLVGPLLAPECKAGGGWTYEGALKQAQDNARDGRYPVVMAKRDRSTPLAIMALDDYCELIALLWRATR